MASGPASTSTADHLQDLLLESRDFDSFLLDLTLYSASQLGADEPILCAISVERAGAPFTVASSGDKARLLDERQYELDDGPCLTALRTGLTVKVDDLSLDERWTRYFETVRHSAVNAVLAVPIDAGEGASAALNCYAHRTSAFGPATVAGIEWYAQSLSRPLRLALLVHPLLDAPTYPDGLRAALRSRATIDAALALVMAHTRSSREAAIALLAEAARARKVRLPALALDIVRGAAIPAGSA
ncbi:GAF domain-containing protein [Arthrobacter sp. HS15c]|uniref:GAF domain-containing protein n=1 Tax=Arthrobacter sp. HS15c TaxID=3230279 RepID=UPI0034673C3C